MSLRLKRWQAPSALRQGIIACLWAAGTKQKGCIVNPRFLVPPARHLAPAMPHSVEGTWGGNAMGPLPAAAPPVGGRPRPGAQPCCCPSGAGTLCWHDVPPQFLHSRLPLAQQPPVSQGRCSGGQGGFPMCWGRAMALRLHDSGSPLLAHSPPGRPVSPTPAAGLQLVMRG